MSLSLTTMESFQKVAFVISKIFCGQTHNTLPKCDYEL